MPMKPRHMTGPDAHSSLTLAADHGRIVASFYDQDGDLTGTTPHPVERSMAQAIAHYQGRGWVLAEQRTPAEGGDGAVSSWWALWSTHVPERLLKLVEYDDRPRTEAEARADLREPVVPLTGRLEPIDRARLERLRKDSEKETRR